MKKNKLFKEAFRLKESNCIIITDRKVGVEAAKASIERHRRLLEEYIKINPRFVYSLEPVAVDKGPRVAALMATAAEMAGVGPMAAVAGVLADLAVEDMVHAGCEVAVIENGGEVYAVSNQTIDVGFAAGDEPLSHEMGFRLKSFPLGVATSSGKYSHALSFGEAEAVTVFAVNAGVADAAATSVANLIKGDNVEGVIRKAIERALKIEVVKGVFILYQGVVGKAGEIPELIKVNPRT